MSTPPTNASSRVPARKWAQSSRWMAAGSPQARRVRSPNGCSGHSATWWPRRGRRSTPKPRLSAAASPVPAERTLGSRRVYEGHIVNLRVDEVELPSGRRAVREIVEHRGAVAVVPVIDKDVVLVRQFRRAADRVLLEIPAGTMEPGETAEACLQRELAEEIGMRAGQVDHVLTFYPSP